MKTTSTLLYKLFAVLIIIHLNPGKSKAQCVAPAMVWQNATLVAGTDGQLDAVYKFPSVTTGVDAFITIKWIVGGAKLTSIDDNTYGYSAAWQPVVKTPEVQGVSNSYIGFKIEFKDSANGADHVYPCFQLSFIDVDGDGQHVREFVAAKNPDSVTVSYNTTLNLTWFPGNLVQAMGPVANFVNIDTSAWATNINYRYSNTDKIIEVRVGSSTDATFTVQNRYSCGFFQQMILPTSAPLPVKYSSFDAALKNNSVLLKWITEDEINNNHFEVQRSFDAENFKTIGLVLDGFASGSGKSYMFNDKAPELQSKTTVYYRLKQIDNNGKYSFTNILVVRLKSKEGVVIQTAPNPFTESLNVNFVATENGMVDIQIININGQNILSKQSSVNKGSNTLQLSGLSKLNTGIYVVKLLMKGEVIGYQKIIKN